MTKTKSQLEVEISEAIIRFEREFMGRGPEETKTYIIDDMVLIRLRGVLTPAEKNLAEIDASPPGPDGLLRRTGADRTRRNRRGTMKTDSRASSLLRLFREKWESRRLLACFLLALALPCAAAGEEGGVDAFYFGNSLTGCTNPQWHADLGRSADKQWKATWWLGAGWQLWQHREQLEAGRNLFGAGAKGDLTIDPELINRITRSYNRRMGR